MQTQRQEQRAREKDFKEQSSLLRFLEEKKWFFIIGIPGQKYLHKQLDVIFKICSTTRRFNL